MSVTIKKEEGNNRVLVAERDGVKVYEYIKDLSTSPMNAIYAYYASEMNVRKRQAWLELNGTGFRMQAGAMQMMMGNIEVKTDVKGVGDFLGKLVKSAVTNETAVKPLYSGNGTIILEPTYKHLLLMDPAGWAGGLVVEDGMYLASADSINVEMQARSNLSSAVLGGEGLFNTKLTGSGVAVLESSCPLDELMEITLDNDVCKIDGPYAVCWSGNLQFTVERTTKTLIGSAASGEGLVNVFRGTGKILVAPVDDLGEEKAVANMTSTNANSSAAKAMNALGKIGDFIN